MLRRLVFLVFIALSFSSAGQIGPLEREDLSFLLDFKSGVVLVPVDRIEGGIMANSLENRQKEESNLAILNALSVSTIPTYFFFFKEHISAVEKMQLDGILLDHDLQPLTQNSLGDLPVFVITFLEPGHISYPEVRTFKETKKGLKCDIRKLEPGPYAKRESEDHLRLIRREYKKTRWSSEELANAKIDELLARETKAYRTLLSKEKDSEDIRRLSSVDGDMFNRDFGRFPVIELRRIEAKHVKLSSNKRASIHIKKEARIYSEMSKWEAMERAIAEIERQIDQRLIKYKKVVASMNKAKK